MKGILLAGGTGSRLSPLTRVTNKHLLPVYNQPMIFYPLRTLINSGLTEIMVVTGKEHAGAVFELLGSGKEFGVKLYFAIQEEAGGIAQALGLCKEFAHKCDVAVILGDSIFEDNFKEEVRNFKWGAHIFLKELHYLERFGVPVFEGDKIIFIEEKPPKPKSRYAVTGFYIYDNHVFHIIDGIKPTINNEIQITDVSNSYIYHKNINYSIVKGFWSDAGTIESLFEASNWVRKINRIEKDR